VTASDFRGLKTECASCHTDVHRAELGVACEKCHTARTFDVSTFTHARQRPFFDGQHATLRCAQCHASAYPSAPARTGTPAAKVVLASTQTPTLRVGFTQTADSCVSCHTDVHLGQVGARCDTCHTVTTARFAIADFKHSNTKFPLTGKHTPLKCEACHTTATRDFPSGHGSAVQFTGFGSDCASCHQDLHRNELGRDCQRCHTTDSFVIKGWYTHLNARSLRGFFVGRHITLCKDCHKTTATRTSGGSAVLATFRIPTACTSCHKDVHRGALGPRCEDCHKP
jgi:hypothetical protein